MCYLFCSVHNIFFLFQSESDGKPGPEGATTEITMTSESGTTEGGIQTEEESADSMMQKLSLIGKIIIDKNVS